MAPPLLCLTYTPTYIHAGTESIILAAKSHRNYYREERGIGSSPEIVACVSAHAAIYKAADLMGIRLVLVSMNPKTYQVDLVAM